MFFSKRSKSLTLNVGGFDHFLDSEEGFVVIGYFFGNRSVTFNFNPVICFVFRVFTDLPLHSSNSWMTSMRDCIPVLFYGKQDMLSENNI